MFLMDNYGRMRAREIAESLGRSVGSVLYKLSKLGLRRASYKYKTVLAVLEDEFGGAYVGSAGGFVEACRAYGVNNAMDVVRRLKRLGLLNYSQLVVQRWGGVLGGLVGRAIAIWTDVEALARTLILMLDYCNRRSRKGLTRYLKDVLGREVVEIMKRLCNEAPKLGGS